MDDTEELAFNGAVPTGVCDAVVSKKFDRLGSDGRAARLGIMGGTFDPVHMGHLACAEAAYSEFNLDAVVFMVAANPSLKQKQALTDMTDRLNMCKLAVAHNSHFDVSAMEMRRGGITYTSDTLRQLREHYPSNVELCFILGSDSLTTLPEWHEAGVVAELARIICVSRHGFEDEELVERAREAGFTIDILQAPLLDISSSEIRRRVVLGKSIRYLVPLSVCDYIRSHKLYTKS
ncbi:nicotinate-nucleotide adenylyltransferase [Adlercreutzia sp. ZJ304]|uniref:nicotinate-nucleotide adenylyltransferase n=1 Tax=Adlercreutzia sp. ZJ304 TaxID=2709791 RepID=UPI001F14F108|nr:nicotinate-nucleotide adenylyltransferase [Adlercreutzia sp. ZJ304]